MPLLVPVDSPLRNPPAAMDARQKVALDALRCSLDAAHISWLRLKHDLTLVMQGFEADTRSETGEGLAAAMTDAWAMVDNLWRIHQVVNRMPHVKKPPELKAHLRALSEVEELRHAVQHIDERFQQTADAGLPLWGTLSWFWTPDGPVSGGKIYATASGALRGNVTFDLINPAGRRIERPIGLVTLSAFGTRLELSTCASRVRAICAGFDAGLRSAFGNSPGSGGDVVFSADFVPTASPGEPSKNVPGV